jgi:rSAM/selenodomain-associated transferase 2
MEISVVIPTFNEEFALEKNLNALSRLQNIAEVIVVDGGSTDRTCEIAENFKELKSLKLIRYGKQNRGAQLHEGAQNAAHEILWFLHADTRPVQGCGRQIKAHMHYREVVGGNFELIFAGTNRWAKFMTWLYPYLRSLGLIYGDSAIFVRRDIYDEIGGFRPLPIFEDLDLVQRIKRAGSFVHINLAVTTSSRRFENRSFILTFLRWSFFQILYWIGFPPRLLARIYKPIR